MKNTLPLMLIFQAFSLINIAQAQTTDAKKWNIHDCFEYATANNIEVNTLRLSEAYSIQNLYAAKGEKIPSLSGLISTSFNNGNNDVLGNGKFVNQLNNTGSYSINSAIVLWNGNFINNNIKQNDLLVQLAGLSVNQSVNNITLQITQAFLNILLAKANLKYVEDLVITSEALVKQSNLLYNAGSVAKINLLQLQA